MAFAKCCTSAMLLQSVYAFKSLIVSVLAGWRCFTVVLHWLALCRSTLKLPVEELLWVTITTDNQMGRGQESGMNPIRRAKSFIYQMDLLYCV